MLYNLKTGEEIVPISEGGFKDAMKAGKTCEQLSNKVGDTHGSSILKRTRASLELIKDVIKVPSGEKDQIEEYRKDSSAYEDSFHPNAIAGYSEIETQTVTNKDGEESEQNVEIYGMDCSEGVTGLEIIDTFIEKTEEYNKFLESIPEGMFDLTNRL